MNNTSQSIQIKAHIHTIPISPVSYLRKPSPLPFSCISFSETPTQSHSIIYSILRVLSFLSLLLHGKWKRLREPGNGVIPFPESTPSPSHIRVRVRPSHWSAVYLSNSRRPPDHEVRWRVARADVRVGFRVGFLAWIFRFAFGLIYSGSLAVSGTPVCLRLFQLRFVCG